MSGFFIFIYTFFKNHKKILLLFLLIILAVSFYFVSKIKLEEDISKARSGSSDKLNLVLKQSKLTDKIIINVSLTDSNEISDPDKLISFANDLVDSLNTKEIKPFIADITYKIDDSLMADVFDLFFANLPVFLDDKDYKVIDSIVSSPSIERSLEKNYNSLLSPAGFTLKKFIMRDPVGISSLAFKKLKQLQFDDNYEIQNGYIFTKDKKHLLLFINPAFPSNKTSENTIFINNLDKIINAISVKNNNTVKAEYFGAVAVAAGNARQIKNDVMFTVILSLLIILIFVGWYFRSATIPFISFLPAVFGGAVALALLFILRTNISVIALAIGSVLLGIIVDYALYIFTLYKTKGSFKEVLKDMSITIALCSITTATAFFSLLFVKSEVLKDLGLFAGFSILGAAIFSLIVLPHTIKPKNKLANNLQRNTFIDKFSNYSFESNRLLIALIVIISVFSLFFSNKVAFETDMYKMNFVSEKLNTAEKNINRINKVSLKSIYIVTTGRSLNEALENNEKTTAVLNDLKNKNIITKYSSPASILISDSIQKERIKRWNDYWTPGKKNILKKNLLLTSIKYGFKEDAFNEFYSFLDKEFKPTDSSVNNKIENLFFNDRIIRNKDLTMVVSLLKADDKYRGKVFSLFSGVDNVLIFDKQKITSGFVENIKTDFELLVNLCLIFVTLVLIIAFGRIELGLIAALPMFISWSWTLGIMAIFGLKFNIFNIIISTFVFGLGVDYSILMIRGLLMEYKYGQKELPSYKTSIFLSVFTTIVGVGVLIFAVHPALNSIALISIIGLLSVVIVSYTIEPVIFYFLTKVKSKKRVVPMSFSDFIFSTMAFSIFFGGCFLMNIVLPFVFMLPVKKKNKKLIMHYLLMGLCWFEIHAMFNVKKRLVDFRKEEFKKPSLIIANHQSHIDLLIILMLNPKIIVVTNNWVWNNPVYSLVIRFLDFYPINDGHDDLMERLKNKVEEGYSILVFPEGSRSDDMKIKRFHKGAFLIAEKLKLDVCPILFHGIGECMTKGENFLKNGTITMKFLKRIRHDDLNYESDYSQRTKSILKLLRSEYGKMIDEYATPRYYKNKLIKNYIYKGPVLEWYLKVKLRLENNYEMFNKFVPKQADIMDIGCGYGFVSYMLNFVSEKRKITGIDYDNDKITLANNCVSKNDKVNFVCADALEYDYTNKDVFIISDVLHYLEYEQQKKLIGKCIEKLNENGIIIIRDGDKNLKQRHWLTLYTEFFSTNSGFNKKIVKKLNFTSGEEINKIISKYNSNLQLQIIDDKRLSSNIFFIIQ
ncbi:MAG: 1-acyl-sn-glycerol-3-phosphate acyltransferase [Bacteroidales bacterium]|nr:1-acyl-sn-glycerol-3-phosphate acyltransferase [Bacteroidales bacterium]